MKFVAGASSHRKNQRTFGWLEAPATMDGLRINLVDPLPFDNNPW